MNMLEENTFIEPSLTFDSAAADRIAADEVAYLNRLLRGELSACETYAQSLEKFLGDNRVCAVLQRIKTEHDQAVFFLQDRIRSLGGVPEETSGIWGTFAHLVEGTAKIFGKKSALIALQEGEDHGVSEYLDVMEALHPGNHLAKFLNQTRLHKQSLEDLIFSLKE